MSNEYAALMRKGVKLPPESKDATGRLATYEFTDEDRDLVRTMAANGVSKKIIAKAMRVAVRTIERRFKDELKDGHDLVTARMGVSLVREGIAGNVAAIKYWLLTRGGPEWKLTRADMQALDPFNTEVGNRETVHFYMPSNGRDEPEVLDDPPTIDGEVEPDSEAA